MRDELRVILRMFGGKLIGSKTMQRYVCEVLILMPQNVVEYITESCWFIGSFDDAYAFTFTGNDLLGQHLIFISDDLLSQDKKQIYYTMAHEIGHVILKHRNSTFISQTKEEVKKQEDEADAFAKKYVE